MKRICLLAAGIGLALAAPAFAQDPDSAVDGTARTLPTVQVQAARVRGVDAFDLPASLTTVDIDRDANRPQAQVSEALAGVPGLLARDRQNYAQDTQLSIRGFGARSAFGVRGVRLLLDGVPATMPDGQGQLSHFNLFGADRIEVLRGPFSALYGNSSGGVLQLWSADGQAGDPWRLRTTWGSHGTATAAAQLLGQQGIVHYDLTATHFRTDGWRDHSRARRESVNGKVGLDLAPDKHLDLVFNYLDAPDAQDPLGLTAEQVRQNPRQATAVAGTYDTRKSVRQTQGGAVYTQDMGAQTLRLMAYAGSRAVEQYLAIPPATQANPLHSGGVVDTDGRYGGLDARWAWRGELAGRPFELTVGANADRQHQHRTGYENYVDTVLGVKGALRRDEIDTVANADQFTQAWWQFAERWSALVGVRHTDVRFKVGDRYVTGTNPDDSGHRDYTGTLPVAGVVFRATDTLRLHASLGRGYETPTFNELGYRADGGAGMALDLAPARSRNYEVGAKWRQQSGASAELALFRADTDDELAVATSSGGRTTYRNIGRTRRQGAEASWNQPIGQTQQLALAWTWIDATVRSPYATGNAGAVVAAGTRLPGVARQQFTARWQWQPRAWQFAAEAVAMGSTLADDQGTARAAGYALYNLEASRRWSTAHGPLRLFARVDNLFDRAYIGSVIVNDGNGRYYEPGPSRGYTVGLQWDFAR
ncbi:TonB-dependent receptor family protein [Xanthomonas massiliensis]|uniref:TonB-dependent receptor family protein n=1 Tax=Xanthomonas massiliensis TaxID=1720302 RepID=UPI0008248A1C|nr:TonB-dependent receptor [Xanthomonas massiliensis]